MENINKFVPQSRKDLLAADIAQTLNDLENLAFYIKCARKYPEPLLWKAFTVARQVPRERIKKSRGALFNYLVHKYAHESQDHFSH